MTDDLATPPDVRRANVRLGLALGAVVVLIIGAFFVLFATKGLPKSPEIWKEMEQEKSAREAATAPDDAPAPAAAKEDP